MSTHRQTPEDLGEDEEQRLAKEIAEGRAAADRGDVVPHERVRDWLLALAQGRKEPPPKP